MRLLFAVQGSCEYLADVAVAIADQEFQHTGAEKTAALGVKGSMDANDVLALGLGVTPPWKLVGQRLDPSRQPLLLEVEAERGALFPCPVCATACKAHDFAEFTWRHLNFSQHQCLITAKVSRTDCAGHGVLRITVPWAREG